MRKPGPRPGLLFRLVVPATAVFIITILSLIAVLFSDERAPVAMWLNRNGNSLLLFELITVLALSFAAMAVDRWITLREIARGVPDVAGTGTIESASCQPDRRKHEIDASEDSFSS